MSISGLSCSLSITPGLQCFYVSIQLFLCLKQLDEFIGEVSIMPNEKRDLAAVFNFTRFGGDPDLSVLVDVY